MISRNYLAEKAFSKIGKVIEVNGRNVVIQVEQHIGKTNLFHNGEIYRNINLGSLVKIEKDYILIVGKVIKEYLKESKFTNNKTSNINQLNRYIDVSIIGHIKNNRLHRGISEIPQIFNEAFILSEKDLLKIYEADEKHTFNIGETVFENIEVNVQITKLFASHIGIFGNTGSGKSNTLTYLLYNLYEKIPKYSIGKSKFLILDFNGEYTNGNTITGDKTNIILSTKDRIDRLKVKKEWLDEEFWGIFLQATEKTQKPFIKRVLNLVTSYEKQNIDEVYNHINNSCVKIWREFLNLSVASYKEVEIINKLKRAVFEFYNIDDTEGLNYLIRDYRVSNQGKISRKPVTGDLEIFNGQVYLNNDEKIIEEIEGLKSELDNITKPTTISFIELFQLCLHLRIIFDLQNGINQYEYISPLLTRFNKRKNEIEKVIEIGDISFIEEEKENMIISISLKNLNTEMKKLIPLLLVKKIYDDHKDSELGDIKSLHFIIDEAHNILSEDSNRESQEWKDYRLEVFEEVIKEGRKFSVFLLIASQRPSDISTTVISQLHNLFIHRLVNEFDLKAIAKSVSFIDKLSFDSLPIIGAGTAIFTGTAIESPMLLKIPELPNEIKPKSETINLDSIWFE